MKTIAIIIAAGRGKRMQDNFSLPKQYLPLGKSTILRESILKFKNHPQIDDVLCVIHKDDLPLYQESIVDLDILNPVIGGNKKNESVYKGLKALKEFSPLNVIIHHANRPFVAKELISGIIKQLEHCDAVITAIKEEENIKISESGNTIEDSLNKQIVWKIQPPEGYKYEILYNLFDEYNIENFNDIPELFENAGLPVGIIPGSKRNFAIINKDDYEQACDIYSLQEKKESEIKVGNGFDCYKIRNGNGIWLCGIKIALKKELETKNKEDTGFNTIADALIGAVGCDCADGCHYDKIKKQESKINLKSLGKLLNKKSTKINNIDITIIGGDINIDEHKSKMVKNIALQLNIPSERVNIKNSRSNINVLFNENEKLIISVVVCVKMN
jgi:2-C-methyl-D-erythritol 4-phosphate cytidylyltransferase / 2-C-methyl-D-erythritol 2,4-cyclodiphosphate synthase